MTATFASGKVSSELLQALQPLQSGMLRSRSTERDVGLVAVDLDGVAEVARLEQPQAHVFDGPQARHDAHAQQGMVVHHEDLQRASAASVDAGRSGTVSFDVSVAAGLVGLMKGTAYRTDRPNGAPPGSARRQGGAEGRGRTIAMVSGAEPSLVRIVGGLTP